MNFISNKLAVIPVIVNDINQHPYIVTLKNNRVTQKVAHTVKAIFVNISNFFYKNFYVDSIFFALNNETLKKEFRQHANLNVFRKFTLGFKNGVRDFPSNVMIVICLNILFSRFKPAPISSNSLKNSLLGNAIIAPITEEIFFRGILQNGVAKVQKLGADYLPNSLIKNKVVNWSLSPSARVVVVNSLFATIHLYNAGKGMTQQHAVIQTLKIMLKPSSCLLHEKTGNIIAPIGSHMANNLIASSLGYMI